jgi:DNA-binding protein WhiA
MAMTAQVKAELATVKVTRPSNRKAEIASTLRFAGGLHIVSGRIVIEAELDTGAAARRLRTEVADVFGHDSELVIVSGRLQPGRGRRHPGHAVRRRHHQLTDGRHHRCRLRLGLPARG